MSGRVQILVLIVASYLVDLLFTLFEFDAQIVEKWHPFYQGMDFPNGFHWDGKVSASTFAYGFFAMVSRAMIFYAAYLAVTYRIWLRIFVVCFWVECADMLDYFLFRNSWWPFIPKFDFIGFKNIEFEFNYLKVLFIATYAYIEWKKSK